MATTDHTDDYLGRDLQNDEPGETDPVLDFLGRETGDDVDYLGRALITP
jgi:hypothetical protein